MFTARFGLNPCMTRICFVFKRLNTLRSMNEVRREERESTSAPKSDHARNKFSQRLLKIQILIPMNFPTMEITGFYENLN